MEKLVINCESGEAEMVALTAEERTTLTVEQTEFTAKAKAEREAKEAARASAVAKMKKLGLTDAEIEALRA